MAQPNRKPRLQTTTGSKPSISRHPLFPGIVALWFAALFGLGGLTLPPMLLESLVLAGHIDHLVPAAAPPLGEKAQLLLALLIGLAGAIAGWVLAKRMARRKPRPAPQVLKVADVDVDLDEPSPRPKASMPAPQRDEDEDAGPVFERSEPAPSAAPGEHSEPVAAEVAPPTAAERIAGAALDSLSHVELIERLAIGLQRRRQRLEAASDGAIEPTDAVVRLHRLGERNSARPMPAAAMPKPVPQETERALRDALATLQRMSGSG